MPRGATPSDSDASFDQEMNDRGVEEGRRVLRNNKRGYHQRRDHPVSEPERWRSRSERSGDEGDNYYYRGSEGRGRSHNSWQKRNYR